MEENKNEQFSLLNTENKNDKKKFKIDKGRILTDVISGSLITIVVVTLMIGLYFIFRTDINKLILGYDTSLTNDAGLARIKAAYNTLSKTYIDSITWDEAVDGAIEGMTKSTGDPYTRYLTETEYQDMLVSGTEKYGGIGVHITYDEKTRGIIILSVMPNSPALEAGLKAGDVILKVDDLVCSLDTYIKAVDQIRGDEGTEVTLQVLRGEDHFEKKIIRKIVQVNNVSSKVLDGNIGYIKILSFENDISNQFKAEYDSLVKDKKVKGLILDLRDNPGGLVDETVSIANMMLPKCEIVRLVYKDGTKKVFNSSGANKIGIPLVVLVNDRSASASEILAGAIKDSGAGELVGVKTFGKGIVQSIKKLNSGGALSITSAKYYTMSGTEIHKHGIEPNYVIELPEDISNEMYVEFSKDTQLQKAVELINGK